MALTNKGTQFYMKWKFGFIRLVNRILDSQFVGNLIMILFGALFVMFALNLFYQYSWKLYLSSVGIYICAFEVRNWINEWLKKRGN